MFFLEIGIIFGKQMFFFRQKNLASLFLTRLALASVESGEICTPRQPPSGGKLHSKTTPVWGKTALQDNPRLDVRMGGGLAANPGN